jgi:hypothetical protein
MHEKYTTIKRLQDSINNDALINLSVDRTGASIISPDVISKIENQITNCSRDFDGYVRGHLTVPILPTKTLLTGTIKVNRGSNAIKGVGTSFITELKSGDEIRIVNNPELRFHIASITDNDDLSSQFVNYMDSITTGATFEKWVDNIPPEVEFLVRKHTCFIMWARRGRQDIDNPFKPDEDYYRKICDLIQRGLYQFESAGGEKISDKPVNYDSRLTSGERVATFTDESLKDYTEP